MKRFLVPESKFKELASEIKEYLERELDGCWQCCGLYMPEIDALIEVIEPIQSCFLLNLSWGTRNLVHGCIPVGTYRVEASKQRGTSSHYIDLVPVSEGPRITACAGYANLNMIDWRGVKKAKESIPA